MTAAKRFVKILSYIVCFVLALAFIIKFGGPNILRQYISYGIGTCKTTPILCMQPQDNIFTPQIDADYRETLIPHTFPKMLISIPKGFALVQELIKQQYYKKRSENRKAIIYTLIQEPGAFIKLYPNVQKQGIKDNAEFIRRLMHARLDQVNTVTDAFFLIMKSIFIPDVGCQTTAKMIRFKMENFQGFINYSMNTADSYFDCNVLDTDGNFFKVYIKDVEAVLDLNKVFTIISTLKPVN
jgi:hypothetical protein